jgi:transcriptional regulator with XRE-family HTH domain
MSRIIARQVMGDVLRARRRTILINSKKGRRRLNQADIARRTGISNSYVSEIERGKKEISSEHLWMLIPAYELTLSELYSEITEEIKRREHASTNS